MGNITTKTIARIAAVQAVYQYQLGDQSQDIEEVITNIANYYNSGQCAIDLETNKKIKLHTNHFSALVRYTIDKMHLIDKFIEESLDREMLVKDMHLILSSMLRTGITELFYFPETPNKVVIDEFTNIASDMLAEKEIGFVNSILDKSADKREYFLNQAYKIENQTHESY